MTRQELRELVAKREVDNAQRAAAGDIALTEAFAAIDKLMGLGVRLELVEPAQAQAQAPAKPETKPQAPAVTRPVASPSAGGNGAK
jgi:hypothetical protein